LLLLSLSSCDGLFVGTTDKNSQGPKGDKGADGQTPYIGTNGNWFIGSIDTGVKAAGTNGTNGQTPYIGTNGTWWVGAVNTGVSAAGAVTYYGMSVYNAVYTATPTGAGSGITYSVSVTDFYSVPVGSVFVLVFDNPPENYFGIYTYDHIRVKGSTEAVYYILNYSDGVVIDKAHYFVSVKPNYPYIVKKSGNTSLSLAGESSYSGGEILYTGENGHWWAGVTDLGVKSSGEDSRPLFLYRGGLKAGWYVSQFFYTSVMGERLLLPVGVELEAGDLILSVADTYTMGVLAIGGYRLFRVAEIGTTEYITQQVPGLRLEYACDVRYVLNNSWQ